MTYRFYATASESWNAMLDAVRDARESIYWESFSLYGDADTLRFLAVLEEKAKAGVAVKGVVDSFGSLAVASEVVERLRESGIEILFFNRLLPWLNRYRLRRWWFCRTHRKILIIDEKTVFTGGVNIGVWYGTWMDLQMKLSGKIVAHFLKTFAKVYRICGGKDDRVLRWLRLRKLRHRLRRLKVTLLEHWPFKRTSTLRRYYKTRIASAKKRVVIVTPYFLPHRWLQKALTNAIGRGVSVNVILPYRTDVWIANTPNHVFAHLLAEDGVKFFFTREVLHAKVLLIDDTEGMVGSNNIDAQSFDYNLESGVVFQRKDMIDDLKSILEHWEKIADPLDAGKAHPWYFLFLVWMAKILRPVL